MFVSIHHLCFVKLKYCSDVSKWYFVTPVSIFKEVICTFLRADVRKHV